MDTKICVRIDGDITEDAEISIQDNTPALLDALEALEDILGAIQKARTMRAPSGHYDEDIYYNGIDFYPQLDIAREVIAKAKGE